MPLLPRKANTEGNKETSDDRTPIAAGTYLSHVTKTQMKNTKAGTGKYLSLQFKVIEGDNKGRSFFTNLNLENPSPQAVEIATKELNSICLACELEDVLDSDELLHIPMLCTLTVKEGNAQWPPQNEITKYEVADEHDGPDVPQVEETASPESDRPWEE